MTTLAEAIPMPNTKDTPFEKRLYTPHLPLARGRLVAEVPSSNSYALESGLGESFYLWTRRQPAGQGRRGRGWLDYGPSNLFLTIYIHKPVWARQGQAISGLSVWLGNWLRHALQDLVEQPLFLKWPNDIVYIDPQGPGEGLRKVCGLLCRSQFVGRELAGVLCGFGVNVGQGLPLQVQEMESQEGYSPGFLRDLVSNPLAKGRVLRQILSELGQGLMGSRDMELIPEDLSSWLLWQGREVVLVPDQHYDGHGVRGLLQGVDKEGSLLIFVPEKNRTEAHVQGRLRAASKERT